MKGEISKEDEKDKNLKGNYRDISRKIVLGLNRIVSEREVFGQIGDFKFNFGGETVKKGPVTFFHSSPTVFAHLHQVVK